MIIPEFEGEYEFLSNFYPSIVKFEGLYYPTVEHAYQAAKTINPERREEIRLAKYPGIAKKMGKSVSMRPDWEDVKIEIMLQLLRNKFDNYPHLCGLLLFTGEAELVEGNWWNDRFWGVCNEEGLNVLGILLMLVREEIREEANEFTR